MRPVINLKPFECFCSKNSFQDGKHQHGIHIISHVDYLVSLDLKDAYFSIPIFKPRRKFLRLK